MQHLFRLACLQKSVAHRITIFEVKYIRRKQVFDTLHFAFYDVFSHFFCKILNSYYVNEYFILTMQVIAVLSVH